MGGKGHSDHSEGKEVSDGVEKGGSDGSEGSEGQESQFIAESPRSTETAHSCPETELYQNHYSTRRNPFHVYEV